MTEDERAVLPHLKHVQVGHTAKCTCPPWSWASCGAQYEGRYDPACPEHRVRGPLETAHYPSGCPESSRHPLATAVEGLTWSQG